MAHGKSAFLGAILLVFLFTACNPEDPPKVVTPPSGTNPGSGEYINVFIDDLYFKGSTGDPVGSGELQLMVVATDRMGNNIALLCPGLGVYEFKPGDHIPPCMGGLSLPAGTSPDPYYLMLVALDQDDGGEKATAVTEVTSQALASALSKFVTLALAPELGTVAFGLFALEVVIGCAGSDVQEYFEQADVIGSQSITIPGNLAATEPQSYTHDSENGQVEFTIRVERSGKPQNRIIGAPSPNPARQRFTPESFTAREERPEAVVRRYYSDTWRTRDYNYYWNLYLTENYKDYYFNGDYAVFENWWDNVDTVTIDNINVTREGSKADAWINVDVRFKDGSSTELNYKCGLFYNEDRKTWMLDYP